MAATKSGATLLNAVTTTQTSGAEDLSTTYAQSLYVKIVQVGTATTAAQWKPQWSPDLATYFDGPTYVAGTAANTYTWTVPIPPDAMGCKASFTQQSGGTSSTCTAMIGTVAGI